MSSDEIKQKGFLRKKHEKPVAILQGYEGKIKAQPIPVLFFLLHKSCID
jgi:hypothetical protein